MVDKVGCRTDGGGARHNLDGASLQHGEGVHEEHARLPRQVVQRRQGLFGKGELLPRLAQPQLFRGQRLFVACGRWGRGDAGTTRVRLSGLWIVVAAGVDTIGSAGEGSQGGGWPWAVARMQCRPLGRQAAQLNLQRPATGAGAQPRQQSKHGALFAPRRAGSKPAPAAPEGARREADGGRRYFYNAAAGGGERVAGRVGGGESGGKRKSGCLVTTTNAGPFLFQPDPLASHSGGSVCVCVHVCVRVCTCMVRPGVSASVLLLAHPGPLSACSSVVLPSAPLRRPALFLPGPVPPPNRQCRSCAHGRRQARRAAAQAILNRRGWTGSRTWRGRGLRVCAIARVHHAWLTAAGASRGGEEGEDGKSGTEEGEGEGGSRLSAIVRLCTSASPLTFSTALAPAFLMRLHAGTRRTRNAEDNEMRERERGKGSSGGAAVVFLATGFLPSPCRLCPPAPPLPATVSPALPPSSNRRPRRHPQGRHRRRPAAARHISANSRRLSPISYTLRTTSATCTPGTLGR